MRRTFRNLLLLSISGLLGLVIGLGSVTQVDYRANCWMIGLVLGCFMVLDSMIRVNDICACARLDALEKASLETSQALNYRLHVIETRDRQQQARLQAAIDESATYGGPTCP